jgi:hypothetical protein
MRWARNIFDYCYKFVHCTPCDLVCTVMNRGGIAAKVEEAMVDRFPRGLCDLVAEYAVMLSAGDWCLMQQPDVVGYKIGVIIHVVQRSYGILEDVHVHECGREAAGARDHYTIYVQQQLQLMDAQRGPMATLHAPKYNGQNPLLLTDLVHGDVDVYTDTGRVPFKWVRPVILRMKYSIEGNVPAHALRIVASGDRARMETMLHKFVTESEVAEVPQVQELIHKRRKLA